MTPAPSIIHQKAAQKLFKRLSGYIEDAGLGEVFIAPVDVELAPNVIVQPDIIVVLNAGLEKITATRIVGAPDLVVEAASPSTALYDRLSKYEAYEQAEIPEYWIVHPQAKSIELLVLEQDGYQSCGIFKGQETLPSRIAPGISDIPVEQFFFHEPK